MAERHFLIVGSGSVGRRHARNLYALGCAVSCVDPRVDRLQQVATEVPLKSSFRDLNMALQHTKEFSGIVIASPPKFHVEQSLAALDEGLPVFLEKPPSLDVRSCRQVCDRLTKGGQVLLGYTYRWWSPVRRLKSLIDARAVGAVRHARFFMSAHLADWHPWERYQDFFMASRDLGGGALLDESHFIDLMIWFFGMPDRLFARVEKISDLEITTDDLVDILATYRDGFRVSIHLDLFGRPHEKQIVVVGDNGTLQCLFNPDEVRVGRDAEPTWLTEAFSVERNDMFVAAAQEFVAMTADGGQPLTCVMDDGLKVMQVLTACRASQRTGREVRVLSSDL